METTLTVVTFKPDQSKSETCFRDICRFLLILIILYFGHFWGFSDRKNLKMFVLNPSFTSLATWQRCGLYRVCKNAEKTTLNQTQCVTAFTLLTG